MSVVHPGAGDSRTEAERRVADRAVAGRAPRRFAPRSLSTSDWLLLAAAILPGLAWVATGSVVFAAIYVPAFWLLSFRRPDLGLAIVFAATPFQNDLSGGLGVRFSIAELSLYLILPVLLVKNGRLPSVGPLLIPVSLYMIVCVAASVSDLRGTTLTSIVQMVQYLLIAVAAFATFGRERPEPMLVCLNALVLVGVLMALCGFATNFRILGLNKNGWGASVAGQVVVAVELWFAASGDRRRKRRLGLAVGVLSVALLLTLSRGGWMAAIVGCGTIVLLRRQYRLAARVTALVLPLLIVSWFLLPQESRDYAAGFDAGQHRNIEARYQSIDYALARFRSSPVLGVGVGLRKEYDATNVMLMTMAETGVLGLAAFALIHGVAIGLAWSAQRSLSRTDPLYPLAALGAALILARLAHGMVDHYWSRGPILSAWAAMGMATAVYLIPPSRRATR